MRKTRSLELTPIGVIHSPYKNRGETPYQGQISEGISQIEVFKEFEEGLKDIEGFILSLFTGFIILRNIIYWLRRPGTIIYTDSSPPDRHIDLVH